MLWAGFLAGAVVGAAAFPVTDVPGLGWAAAVAGLLATLTAAAARRGWTCAPPGGGMLPMDDFVAPLLTVLAVAVIGWLLGIIGFFKANRAIRELDQLRRESSRRTAGPQPDVGTTHGPDVAFDPVAAEPPPGPEPIMPEPVVPEPAMPDPVIPETPRPAPVRPRRDLEELLAARWGVWLGAAALLLAAVFLVRYAAEQDLLGPGIRCATAVALGVALIAGAEWLQRRSAGPASLVDYAPGALAAGGVGAWFTASYMAGIVYGLVFPPLAFALLAASSLAGLALSLRYGPLVAAVGVVGAFTTPFLVGGTDPSLPLMFGYFLFVAASAFAVVRYTAWAWLGWATTVACAGLVALAAAASGGIRPGDLWGPAMFVPATGLLALALLPGAALDSALGRRLAYVPAAALGAAGLLLCYAMPDPVTRAGVLLLAAVALAKGATEDRLDLLPWLGAALFLLLLGVWGLPAWGATGEQITTEGTVIAVLPGDWAPAVLRPLLATAAAGAAIAFAAGLWGERRRARPLRWSALAAAVPVLTLGLLFWRVTGLQSSMAWAAAAVAVAAATTAAAVRAGTVQRAGVHAAGATAAMALACGMVLSAEWLTVALALFVPALAIIEHSAGLPPLRRVALAVAGVVGVRLLLNGAVLDDADGQSVATNVLLPAYLVAAASFGVGARLFRRGGDDLLVAVLELGSAAFVASLAVLEVRQWATGGHPAGPDAGFVELAADTAALSVLAAFALHLRARTGRMTLGWAATAGAAVAAVLGAGLIVVNPAFTGADAGSGAIFNTLPLAYVVPAGVALWATRRPDVPARLRPFLAVYALAALFTYVTLAVRQFFHPGAMGLDGDPVTEAELWAWSGVWLLFGLTLMAAGVVTATRALRLSALAIVALATAKVFLFDMAGLTGLWRVVSFLALGLTLIALGAVYRRFVATGDPAPAIPGAG